MNKQTAVVYTYCVVFLGGAVSSLLGVLWNCPPAFTAFEMLTIAFLAAIMVGVGWEDKK